jgi:hypothetical protein
MQRVRWFFQWEAVVEWQEIDADGFYVCPLQPSSQSEMLSKTFEKQCQDQKRCKHATNSEHLRTNMFAG